MRGRPRTMSPGCHVRPRRRATERLRRPGLLRGLLDPRALRGRDGTGPWSTPTSWPSCPMSTGGGCWTWDAAPTAGAPPRLARSGGSGGRRRVGANAGAGASPVGPSPRQPIHGVLGGCCVSCCPVDGGRELAGLPLRGGTTGAGRAHCWVARARRRARLLDRRPPHGATARRRLGARRSRRRTRWALDRVFGRGAAGRDLVRLRRAQGPPVRRPRGQRPARCRARRRARGGARPERALALGSPAARARSGAAPCSFSTARARPSPGREAAPSEQLGLEPPGHPEMLSSVGSSFAGAHNSLGGGFGRGRSPPPSLLIRACGARRPCAPPPRTAATAGTTRASNMDGVDVLLRELAGRDDPPASACAAASFISSFTRRARTSNMPLKEAGKLTSCRSGSGSPSRRRHPTRTRRPASSGSAVGVAMAKTIASRLMAPRSSPSTGPAQPEASAPTRASRTLPRRASVLWSANHVFIAFMFSVRPRR